MMCKPTAIAAYLRRGFTSERPLRTRTAKFFDALDARAADVEAKGMTLAWDQVVLALVTTAARDKHEKNPVAEDDPFA